MRKKTLRRRIMCGLLTLVFLASLFQVQLPVEAAKTATIPITVGGQTYNVTPGQWVTVNTPGGSTSYNVRFVDGKPVALEMSQYQQIIFGDGGSSAAAAQAGSSSAAAQTSNSGSSSAAAQTSNSGSSSSAAAQSSTAATSGNTQMTWNEFQKANSGKGMSSSEMSQAWKDYKAGNTGSTSTGSTQSSSTVQSSVAEGATTTSSSSSSSSTTQASADTSAATSQKTSNWDPAKHPRDPQTGKFISHEEAIARGLMDPADANVSGSSSQSSQTAQSGEATQASTAEGSASASNGAGDSSSSSQTAQAAQTSEGAAAGEGKTKTSIGDKFKAGYETGKNLTNQGFQNVKDSLKSGFSAKNLLVTAGITVGVDLATQIMRGEKPSLKSALKTVCCAEFAGSVVGSVTGAAAGSFFTPFLSCIPVVGGVLGALAPTFGSVVGSSVGAYVAGDLKNGRFSIKEAFKRIDWVGVTGQTIGSTAGAALGSFLGPVGTVIGGMVGGYLGNWAAHKIAGLFGKGNANLPTISMPTGTTGNEVSTSGTVTIGGSDVTSVTISDEIDTSDDDNNTPVEAADIDAQITAAYEEYTQYYTEYSQLIQAGKTEEALEVAEKMNEAKAKYDALRYGNDKG